MTVSTCWHVWHVRCRFRYLVICYSYWSSSGIHYWKLQQLVLYAYCYDISLPRVSHRHKLVSASTMLTVTDAATANSRTWVLENIYTLYTVLTYMLNGDSSSKKITQSLCIINTPEIIVSFFVASCFRAQPLSQSLQEHLMITITAQLIRECVKSTKLQRCVALWIHTISRQ
jgi:hypothetical protein